MKTTAKFRQWLAEIGGRLDGTMLYLGNTKVSLADLTPLKGMRLSLLDLRGTPAAEGPLPSWLDESIVVR